MKLVLENTTLRTTFQYLAGAIGLHDVDPCQVDGTSFLQASTSLKLKVEPAPMTPNDYPLSPKGQTSKQGTMGFLEDKDSKPPSCETVKAICRLLHGGWVELVHQELAPPSAYPNFKLANNGWKLDYLASITYPAWWKGTLDDNSKWKQKKGKWPKIEDEDENDSTDEVGMKWKGVAFKSEGGPWKHFKGEHKEEDDPPSDKSTTSFEASTTLLSALMCTSPTNTDHNVEAPPSLSSPLCDQVEESIQCDLDTDPNAVSINQLTETDAGSDKMASKARPILELEDAILPIATSALSAVPPVVDNSMAVSVNKTMKGSGKLDFQAMNAQPLQAYDKEAAVLATSNTWDAKSICNSTLH
ncbi:hypothetical protein EV401DRAFT_1895813 [Pisolithus croceorrhizus]|nr:hypothetical protein EV401DRAFT_1895813 [Pisolithus croceorrhizus]